MLFRLFSVGVCGVSARGGGRGGRLSLFSLFGVFACRRRPGGGDGGGDYRVFCRCPRRLCRVEREGRGG